MIKNERLLKIQEELDRKNVIKVSDIVEDFNISDMTARRDLSELEDMGLVKRVHGGAISVKKSNISELSHKDKQILNIDKKEDLTDIASNIINNAIHETFFFGPGTTVELLARKVTNTNISIYTNCLPVFEVLFRNKINVFLLGGEMRERTMSFNGEITNLFLKNFKFHKSFFSCNGIIGNDIMTATIIEGNTQYAALSNSAERYLLVDDSKFNKNDFYTYFETKKLTALITNKNKDIDYTEYRNFTNIMYK